MARDGPSPSARAAPPCESSHGRGFFMPRPGGRDARLALRGGPPESAPTGRRMSLRMVGIPAERSRTMSVHTLASIESTVHTTNAWLNELMAGLGWDDRQKAYHALRVVLHALRDRLTVA